MSDYTKVYDGAALDTAEAVLAGADFDVDFSAIEVAVATKADKTTLASLLTGEGSSLIGVEDVDTYFTATTVESVLAEIGLNYATKAGTETLTNKTLTSAVLSTSVSGTAFLDEDNMASNSATKLASQQSIKAYVDGAVDDIRTIRVNATPTVLINSGLGSASTSGTGKYTITHTIGSTSYTVVATPWIANAYAVVNSVSNNAFEVYIYDSTGTLINGGFSAMLFRV